jgi:hypothetical protein
MYQLFELQEDGSKILQGEYFTQSEAEAAMDEGDTYSLEYKEDTFSQVIF